MEKDTNRKPYQHIYVIMNPIAGHSKVEDLQPAIEKHFSDLGWSYEIYETTGKENLSQVARDAHKHGADLVVAAGGDGTVSGVVNGLVKEDVPLGIIPVGTGNGLARAMGIPLAPQEALKLLTGDHIVECLDAMQVGDKYYILNVSAGISSRAMRETTPEVKRRLGVLAYAQNILKDLAKKQTAVFKLSLDGNDVRLRAAEVLVANGTIRQEGPLLFGDRDFYHDGELEVNILTATQTKDYVRLAWDLLLDKQDSSGSLKDLTVKHEIRLDVSGGHLPVQGDGEVIGKTPVDIKMVPGALQVIIPPDKGSK